MIQFSVGIDPVQMLLYPNCSDAVFLRRFVPHPHAAAPSHLNRLRLAFGEEGFPKRGGGGASAEGGAAHGDLGLPAGDGGGAQGRRAPASADGGVPHGELGLAPLYGGVAQR